MPTKPLDPEFAERWVAHRRRFKSHLEACREWVWQDGRQGVAPATASNWQRAAEQYAAQGVIGGTNGAVLPGYTISKRSTYYNADGVPTGQWVQEKPGAVDPQLIVDALTGALEEFKGLGPVTPAPACANADLLTLYPRPDDHLGLMSWGRESGEDWDLAIAREEYAQAHEALVDAAPASETALFVGMGDTFHSDNQTNRTPNSGHQLDVDGRYPKVLEAGAWLYIHAVLRLLGKHQRVVVKILPGNHDPHPSVALGIMLKLYFHNEPRVEVDVTPPARWYWRHGVALLGFTHGDRVKQAELPMLMANERADDWAPTTCRRFYTGHLHHKRVIEHGGVVCEQFRAPVPKDAYHAAGPWMAGRSLSCINFSRARGEIGRTEWTL